jgi:hypothetical protein
MKSSFWHIGVNKSIELNSKIPLASRQQYRAPRIGSDGSIECKLLPDHEDPDFGNCTYGEPWGRIDKLLVNDIAFFIESGTGDEWKTWAYYLVAVFVTENVYHFREGIWTPSSPRDDHLTRIRNNAHFRRNDPNYAVLLGNKAKSRIMFDKPSRISQGEEPTENTRLSLKLDPNSHYTGYWWKRWFENDENERFLKQIGVNLQ